MPWVLPSPRFRAPRSAWTSGMSGTFSQLGDGIDGLASSCVPRSVSSGAGPGAIPGGLSATGPTPSSPDTHVRKRGRSPFVPCAGQACAAPTLAPPGSLPPHRRIHPRNQWAHMPTLAAATKCLAAFHSTRRHRSAACCRHSHGEKRKPPTLMRRSAVPPRSAESCTRSVHSLTYIRRGPSAS